MITWVFGKSHPDLMIYILGWCTKISDQNFKRDLSYTKAAMEELRAVRWTLCSSVYKRSRGLFESLSFKHRISMGGATQHSVIQLRRKKKEKSKELETSGDCTLSKPMWKLKLITKHWIQKNAAQNILSTASWLHFCYLWEEGPSSSLDLSRQLQTQSVQTFQVPKGFCWGTLEFDCQCSL